MTLYELYTYVGDRLKPHLIREGLTPDRVIYRHTETDKYDLKVRHSTLRTLTNSLTLRARKIVYLIHLSPPHSPLIMS